MAGWLKAAFGLPQVAGPPRVVRQFSTADATLSRDCLREDGDGWVVDCSASQTVRLFELEDPGLEQCLLTYRAQLRSRGLRGRAYLEMWCRLPGRGEFFSKGLRQQLTGTTDCASYETPFVLRPGQRPDLIKLNLVVEGCGEVGISGVEVLAAPLS